tara:strand:- start:1839 stop:3338 length:1500 start_codon:yes stop_codon:yes gene_type:complete
MTTVTQKTKKALIPGLKTEETPPPLPAPLPALPGSVGANSSTFGRHKVNYEQLLLMDTPKFVATGKNNYIQKNAIVHVTGISGCGMYKTFFFKGKPKWAYANGLTPVFEGKPEETYEKELGEHEVGHQKLDLYAGFTNGVPNAVVGSIAKGTRINVVDETSCGLWKALYREGQKLWVYSAGLILVINATADGCQTSKIRTFEVDGVKYVVKDGAPYKKVDKSGQPGDYFLQRMTVEDTMEVLRKRKVAMALSGEKPMIEIPKVIEEVKGARTPKPLTTLEKAFIQEWKGKINRIVGKLSDEAFVTVLLTLVPKGSRLNKVKVMHGLLGDRSPSMRACHKAISGAVDIPNITLPEKVAGPLFGPLAKATATKKLELKVSELELKLAQAEHRLAQAEQTNYGGVREGTVTELETTKGKLTAAYIDIVDVLAVQAQVIEFVQDSLDGLLSIGALGTGDDANELRKSFAFLRRTLSNEQSRAEDLEAHSKKYLEEHLGCDEDW